MKTTTKQKTKPIGGVWRLLNVSYCLIFVMVLLSSNSYAVAQDKRFSLKEAVNYALQNNYELKALQSGLMAQKEDIAIAKSHLLPKLTFEGRFMRTNNPVYSFMSKLNQSRFTINDFEITSLNNPRSISDFQTSLSIEQPVYVKKAYVGIDMSKKEFEAKTEELNHRRQEIAMKVVEAFLAIRSAKEMFEASKQSLQEAQEHLKIAQLRYKNELGLFSDTLRAETMLKEAEQQVVTAEKNLNLAKKALALLMGIEGSVDIEDEGLTLTAKELTYYQNHLSQRKDLRAMQMRLENAHNNIRLTQADFYPIVGIGGSYQINDHRRPFGAEGDSWQVMAFLRWNIFDGTKRYHETSKAKHQAKQISDSLTEMKRGLAYKLYEAYQNYLEAMKNLEIANKAYETAKEGMRLVKVRYENGLSPIVDLISAKSSLDRARANLIMRDSELKRTIANLSFESGLILKELAIE